MSDPKREAIEAIAQQAETIADQAAESLGNLADDLIRLGEPGLASVLACYIAPLGDLSYRLRGRVVGGGLDSVEV